MEKEKLAELGFLTTVSIVVGAAIGKSVANLILERRDKKVWNEFVHIYGKGLKKIDRDLAVLTGYLRTLERIKNCQPLNMINVDEIDEVTRSYRSLMREVCKYREKISTDKYREKFDSIQTKITTICMTVHDIKFKLVRKGE